MHHFTELADVPDLPHLLETAKTVAQSPFSLDTLGRHKTLGLIFFNSSLRTRLSSQKAARNLGMEVIVMNVSTDGWQLEFQDGAIMNQGKAEHIKDAAAVMGSYCDILGVRSFPSLTDRDADYAEQVLTAFKKYSGVPVVSLESATRHPLQSLTDVFTIQSHWPDHRPKVVLTWAPHPRALPQAVANSFAEWMNPLDVDFVITHPEGYELHADFVGSATVTHDQRAAFEQADFIYAKNWSSYSEYGQILRADEEWMVTAEKMALTRQAKFMHCLPVRRNVVVADEVMDSAQNITIEQAGNRVVGMQAVLVEILQNIG
ncbi:N-acetylornithine carbamoyltransferase [Pontibacter sp. G13]|uniref:N-acetylornithine carbamoyltransferase n=1 Tax=Pontibacter sp. G13 TaxID=3074898 RepID=UPI002889DEFE|nr:N-acetylornithine carbamoyltransferase [Pontibacter sp. G13]WNJ16351.1 N-acetylornithine carbamoyltransferase [Pontibacter sp. G13]